MTVFTSDAAPPVWCELEHFAIVAIDGQKVASFARRSAKERVVVASGNCQVVAGVRTQVLNEGQFFDLAEGESGWEYRATGSPCRLVRVCGRWGNELGGCGVFTVRANGPRVVTGDPVDYPKDTGFDSHYHDCDEYWLMVDGNGTVVVGPRHFTVGPGDCIAIGMGHHHDFPAVTAPVKAVYFETTLEGRKRTGHLWNHTHGLAQPKPERV